MSMQQCWQFCELLSTRVASHCHAGGERGVQLRPGMAAVLRHHRGPLLLLALPVCVGRCSHRRHVHSLPVCGHRLRHPGPARSHRARPGTAPSNLSSSISMARLFMLMPLHAYRPSWTPVERDVAKAAPVNAATPGARTSTERNELLSPLSSVLEGQSTALMMCGPGQ